MTEHDFKVRIPAGDDFLDPAEVATLDASTLRARTEAIAPLLRERAANAERLRRPDPEVWSAIRRSGFFYLFVPRAFGGLGADPDTFIDAALPLAKADPGTAWSACFVAGHNQVIAHFPEAAQQEVWGTSGYVIAPQVSMPPGMAKRVECGYRISGSWSWGSGIMDADYVVAVVMLGPPTPEAPPPMGLALIRASEVTSRDTWHVAGLASSGSNDVIADDVFVPDHRVLTDLTLFTGHNEYSRFHEEPIFGFPAIPFSSFIAVVPILGAAMGLLDLYREALPSRIVKGRQGQLGENAAAQVRLARADVMIDTAEQLIRAAARRALAASSLANGEQMPIRARLRMEFAYAAQLCRDAARLIADGSGSSIYRNDNPFQRLLRDISVMSSHVAFDMDAAAELHGRVLLGMPPTTMIL
ncbi:acyl-CoA dehydrogenase family protein [Oryzifoliimicrobium ureilyticus]|uniref:acyl-CoA dehydrogenase family protein n=1 Tax=Oryzifoliimicrobium ureilyticus TaxID=3113724 RepID=UPI0030764915